MLATHTRRSATGGGGQQNDRQTFARMSGCSGEQTDSPSIDSTKGGGGEHVEFLATTGSNNALVFVIADGDLSVGRGSHLTLESLSPHGLPFSLQKICC